MIEQLPAPADDVLAFNREPTRSLAAIAFLSSAAVLVVRHPNPHPAERSTNGTSTSS